MSVGRIAFGAALGAGVGFIVGVLSAPHSKTK